MHALEIPRRDLSAILANAARDHAEYLYHESVTALVRDGSGIEVTFERGIRAGSTSSSGLMGCIRECAG